MKLSNLESQIQISKENSIFHFLFNKLKKVSKKINTVLQSSRIQIIFKTQYTVNTQQDMKSHDLASAFQILSQSTQIWYAAKTMFRL